MQLILDKLTNDKDRIALVFHALKLRGGYCPCSIMKDEDHICPCKEYRETEYCHCKLYVSTKS